MKKEKTGTLPEYCIWDFNGTILDDVETGIRAVNVLLSERGLPILQGRADYQSVFCFPIRHYYERLGFDFEKEAYEIIAPQWVEQYLHFVKDAPLFDDVKRTLERFRASGIRQIILSATELDMLRKQLKDLEIEEYFEEVLGLDNIHAASKLSLAKDWRDRHPTCHAIFIGDTDHDCDAARTMNVECLLVSRGHQSEEYLRSLSVPVFSDLESLSREILKNRI